MEKYSYKTKELEAERNEYRHEISILEATEGWSLLTSRQKQIIRVCLYLQDRAERDMDPAHKNDPYYFDWHRKSSFVPQFQSSLEHIKQYYCHVAVNALEKKDLSPGRPKNCTHDFFDGDFIEIKDVMELKMAVEAFGFPCVVHVSRELGNTKGESSKMHTFLALGHAKDGSIVIWEKVRVGEPYRVSTLQKVYRNYPESKYWGFRKLR